MIELLNAFLISIAIQLVLFVPAYIFKTDKLTDLSYGLTFVILSVIIFVINKMTITKLILMLMIILWGFRLASYLLIRVIKMKRDKRFDNIRENFFKFLSFWVLQGVSVWIILLPTLLYFYQETKITIFTYIGFFVWLLGFSIEAIADQQKFKFKNKNKDKFISTGIWKYSRHPNYFGEILCWIGIYIFVFLSLTNLEKIIGLIGPIFIIILLLFVTGIPKLEILADKRYGKLKNYKEYKRKTSILIPWFIKK